MSELRFAIVGARAEPYTAQPTIVFRLRIEDGTGRRVHAMTLRGLVQIEPKGRHYGRVEQEALYELFDVPRRWGETLGKLVWTTVSVAVPGFTGSTEIDLPIVCTYDFDVTATKYFQALEDGEIPLLFLWSGTAFLRAGGELEVAPIAWDRESPFRLPVAVWRETIERHFPGTAWLRLRRETMEALYAFKARRALPTFDEALEALLVGAESLPLRVTAAPPPRREE